MSSSRLLERLVLTDLTREAPPAQRAGFEERVEFDRIERGPIREITPQEAYQSGLAEGERLGRQAATKELVPVIEELRALGRAMALVRAERLQAAEADVVCVATELARRILHGELAQDGDTVVRLARACIQEASQDGPAVLHVHPEDLDLVRTHAHELVLDLADAELEITPDAGIARGSCVLETPTRCFDGRPEHALETALARLRSREGTR
jgi:flagellar assembly protein FliH